MVTSPGDATACRSPAVPLPSPAGFNDAIARNLAVMDASALSMARDNKKRIRVFGLEEPGNVTRALVGDEIGTLVSTAESRVAE